MRHLPEDMPTRDLVAGIQSPYQTEFNKAAYTAELLHRKHSEQEGLEDVMSQ
jgi:hypothetical protein